MWAWYGEQERIKDHLANLEEAELARQAERAGHIANEEIDGEIEWGMSKRTWVQLHRASLHERGAVGGELLRDDDYMKWFLKRNEACRRKSRSGNITEGYTARLEAAVKYRKTEEIKKQARVASILDDAAAAGKNRIVA